MTTMNMEVNLLLLTHNAIHKMVTFYINFSCLDQALSLFDRPKRQTSPVTDRSKEIMGKDHNAVVTILPPARE